MMKTGALDAEWSASTRGSEDAAVSVVDRTLAIAAHRRVYTDDEVRCILDELRSSVRDEPICVSIGSWFSDVLIGGDASARLERWRVVDALLDVRLMLRPPA